MRHDTFLHGMPPTLVGSRTPAEHHGALADQIRIWNKGGIDASSIAVCARAGHQLQAAEAFLRTQGVPTVMLGSGESVGEGVRLGTMHHLKGLEFQCVAVVRAILNRCRCPPH
jgi:superfamily I DNA/RNA helicase